jgi:hypothetical protein
MILFVMHRLRCRKIMLVTLNSRERGMVEMRGYDAERCNDHLASGGKVGVDSLTMPTYETVDIGNIEEVVPVYR